MIKRILTFFGVTFFIISSLLANQGGTDTFGHMWTDSKGPQPRVDYDWIDIKANWPTSTRILNNTDNSVVGPVPIGFDFTFYGSNHNQVYVSSNGFISFRNLSDSY